MQSTFSMHMIRIEFPVSQMIFTLLGNQNQRSSISNGFLFFFSFVKESLLVNLQERIVSGGRHVSSYDQDFFNENTCMDGFTDTLRKN